MLIFARHQLASSVGNDLFTSILFFFLKNSERSVRITSLPMEVADTSDQHLNASDRQMQALTANIQQLARQSAADRREMQELTRQN